MPSVMERVFGAFKPAPNMQVNNPTADPKVGAIMPNNQSVNEPAKPVLPLDEFATVWDTPKHKEGEGPTDPFASPLLTADPVKIKEAVSKMNFLEGTPPELLAKIASGDTAALSQVVNTAIQRAVGSVVQLNANTVEGAINRNNERMNSVLPEKIRNHAVNNIRSSNPVLDHPATAPFLESTKKQIAATNPDMTPQEVHARAEAMLTTFGEQLVGHKTETAAAARPKDSTDFSNWG